MAEELAPVPPTSFGKEPGAAASKDEPGCSTGLKLLFDLECCDH